MDQLKKKFPNGAISFYIHLYCKRKNKTVAEFSNAQQEAMKSWTMLKKNEKRFFENKFNEYRRNYLKNIAIHLKNVEPYLKSKVTNPVKTKNSYHKETDADGEICRTSVSKTEVDDNEDMNATMSHFYASQNNGNTDEQDFNHDIYDSNCLQVPQLEEDDVISIPEPTPPKIMTAKELFLIINETEQNNEDWAILTQAQKTRYRQAVLSIKKKYLMEYKTYLEHLTSEKLFKYYRNIVNSNN